MNAITHLQSDEELRQVERRARLLQAANQVGRQASSILDLDKLLAKAVDIICDAYGFYYAGVLLVDSTGKWAVLHAGRGAAGAVMLSQGHKLEVGGNSMVGWAIANRKARIALDVGEDRVHFKNPLLPHTRSEMALPLMVGEKVLGALTVQSTEERAFSEEDILTLQTMADHLAIAIHNARLIKELERSNAELLRAKTYEALTTATTQAIHWIGNKALPITTTVARMKADLQAGELNPESLLEDLALVEENARLIVEVKEDLLGPARETPPRPAMLGDVAQAAAFQAGLQPSQIKIEVAPHLAHALVDTTQLVRALGHLYRNALEANATQINVTIAPSAEAGFISLEVSDNGQGISPEMLDTIWAAFVSTKVGHTGLGLPATLLVINQLHGRITVTSQVGQGTTFHLLLPTAPMLPETLAAPGGPETILLIDDDDAWSRFALSTLQGVGKNVTCHPKLTGDPDLIIVDEALEAAYVMEVLDELKKAGVIGRTVVVSPALTVETATVYLQAGVKNALLKPYSPNEFAALLVE